MRANRNKIEIRFNYKFPEGLLTSLYLYLEDNAEKLRGDNAKYTGSRPYLSGDTIYSEVLTGLKLDVEGVFN
jgi:hypothetical protein